MTGPLHSPTAYVTIATVGLALGWVLSRLASGARDVREFIPNCQAVDWLAMVLAGLFAERVLPEPRDANDVDRVMKNGLTTASVMLLLALVASGVTGGISSRVAVLACLGVAVLEVGEALVAYGVADETAVRTQTEP